MICGFETMDKECMWDGCDGLSRTINQESGKMVLLKRRRLWIISIGRDYQQHRNSLGCGLVVVEILAALGSYSSAWAY